ncbi:hypothetical protein [Streptomyces sp. RKAG293]|uniref:hypothetical protein n=1 Tax=Streptomyces sp. RKAG293 TaxID=2893403 RepID=UPI002033B9D8|nr:hypothetical protein [Streptomyces sp. RKAG293]MCM2424088.1 hypothetical protein [Streptomyces sp. RKAG293]
MKKFLVLLGALALAAASGTATAVASCSPSPDRWTETGVSYVNSQAGGQGLASWSNRSLLFRGNGSIPQDLRDQGWTHVGDPEISRQHIFDAYQGNGGATAKMFAVTTPGGKRLVYTHQLQGDERMNNSFAAVSPDAQWLVSGEWDQQDRLLVFPAPVFNTRAPAGGGELPEAGRISLDHPVRDIQGCDFVSARRLVCASDDSTLSLWPVERPLFQVDLDRALDGKPVTGRVSVIRPLPQRSACAGTGFETEGVDYDARTGTLRVEMIPPGECAASTAVYTYKAR